MPAINNIMKVIVLNLLLLSTALSISGKVTCGPGDTVIPNPEDCGSFYNCGNGIPILTQCPPTLHFNPEVLVCDRPENVNCQVAASSTAEPATTTTTAAPTTASTTAAPTTTSTTATPTTASTTTAPTTTSTTATPTTTSTTAAPTTTSTTAAPTTTSTAAAPTTTSSTVAPTNPSTTEKQSTTAATTTSTEYPTNTSTTEKQTTTTEQPGFEPDCPEEGYAIIGNPESCSSFYVCVNGNFGLVQCPADLDFNPATVRCDLPANPQCKAGTTPPPPPYIPPCPKNGTVQLPDPSSCESFYICINGNYAKLTCPDDFEFNVTTQSCVHPVQSTCNRVITYELAIECEEDGSYPNPEDCTKYYVCVGGQPISMDCPGGLHFDVSLETCNTPDQAKCEISTPPSTSSTQSTEESSTTKISTISTNAPTEPSSTSTEQTTSGGSGNEPNCPDEGSTVLPNPEDCTQFFICIEGSYELEDCPKGYAFNPKLGRCDLAENVENCNAPNHPECPSEGSAKLPNPEDCGSYIFCLNGESAVIPCPDGLNYDEVQEMCREDADCPMDSTTTEEEKPTSSTSSTTTEKVTESSTSTDETSTSSEPTPGKCSEEGALEPNPDDCTTFFQCANGVLVLQMCPPGLEFNANQRYCDNPSTADCSEKKTDKSIFSFLKFWKKF